MSSLIYFAVKKLSEAIQLFYFRKVFLVGIDNIPKDGPVFICGNHSNQFIDAIMVLASVNRHVSFTMAASSFKKKVIGFFASLIKAIPVVRPEDLKIKGTGKVKLISQFKLQGIGTDFFKETENLNSGWSISFGNKTFQISKVVDKENIDLNENSETSNMLNIEYDFSVSTILIKNSIFQKQIIVFYLKRSIHNLKKMLVYVYFLKELLMIEQILLS